MERIADITKVHYSPNKWILGNLIFFNNLIMITILSYWYFNNDYIKKPQITDIKLFDDFNLDYDINWNLHVSGYIDIDILIGIFLIILIPFIILQLFGFFFIANISNGEAASLNINQLRIVYLLKFIKFFIFLATISIIIYSVILNINVKSLKINLNGVKEYQLPCTSIFNNQRETYGFLINDNILIYSSKLNTEYSYTPMNPLDNIKLNVINSTFSLCEKYKTFEFDFVKEMNLKEQFDLIKSPETRNLFYFLLIPLITIIILILIFTGTVFNLYIEYHLEKNLEKNSENIV